MSYKSRKAFQLMIRLGSFLVLASVSLAVLDAAEVRRSLSLEDRVRLLEQQLSAANRLRAESQFEITNLKNEIRELRGAVEEQGYQLQQIVSRQRELYKDIDQRLSNTTSPTALPNANINPTTVVQSVAQSVPDTRSTDTEQQSKVQQSTRTYTNDEIRSMYDKIFPLVRSKRYEDAILGYQQFITQFPDSSYVANSRYWLAQIFSVLGRTDEAEQEYLLVANNYSTSSKASDSWLKLGKLYEQKNLTEQAIEAYNQVITKYSSSTAAKIAVSRLQDLKSSEN